MEGMEGKLQKILENPDAMESIMKLAKSFSGSGAAAKEPEKEEVPAVSALSGGEGAAGLSGLMENMDPDFLMKVMSAVGEFSRTDDNRIRLLNSLKPYVKPERAAKMDKAQQYLRVARAAGHMLGGKE